MSGRSYKVYVVKRKGRYTTTPRDTGRTCSRPALTIQHEGETYYFATMDLSRGYVTYSDTKPAPAT